MLWALGMWLTGTWVVLYGGYLLFNAEYFSGSILFALVTTGSVCWLVALAVGLLWRTRAGLWVATVPLLVTAGIATSLLVRWLG